MNIMTYLALGSNADNPKEQLSLALKSLAKIPSSRLDKVSSFYQSPFQNPATGTLQADCINAVAKLETALSAQDLLQALHTIEQTQGRVRSEIRNTARTLDLDIILYGDEHIQTPELCIPHPRFLERAFVLIPLFEISPSLVLPNGQALKNTIRPEHYQHFSRLD